MQCVLVFLIHLIDVVVVRRKFNSTDDLDVILVISYCNKLFFKRFLVGDFREASATLLH